MTRLVINKKDLLQEVHKHLQQQSFDDWNDWQTEKKNSLDHLTYEGITLRNFSHQPFNQQHHVRENSSSVKNIAKLFCSRLFLPASQMCHKVFSLIPLFHTFVPPPLDAGFTESLTDTFQAAPYIIHAWITDQVIVCMEVSPGSVLYLWHHWPFVARGLSD